MAKIKEGDPRTDYPLFCCLQKLDILDIRKELIIAYHENAGAFS